MRRYLLDAPSVLPGKPALVATIAHDKANAVYKALDSTLASEVDHVETLYLHPASAHLSLDRIPPGSGAPIADPLTSQTAAAIAHACPTLSIQTPCGLSWSPPNWHTSLRTFMTMWSHVSYRYTLTQKMILIGAPVFNAQLRLVDGDDDAATGFQGAGLNVALMYTPPGAPPTARWFLTQGMATFDHVDANGFRNAKIELDDRVFTFEAGGVLELVLGNLSPGLVHHQPVRPLWCYFVSSVRALLTSSCCSPSVPTTRTITLVQWVNPLMFPFSASVMLGGADALQASISLPLSNKFDAMPSEDTSAWEQPYWTQ